MPYKDREQKNAAARAAYARRSEEIRAGRRERYANDPNFPKRDLEKRRAADRARYAANPEKYRQDQRDRYKADPERYRDTARRAHAAVMERDPESVRARSRQRWALEKGAEGVCTAADWVEVLAFYGGWCLCCSSEDEVTQDHVIPLTLGGTHWPDNLQPLCKTCNSAKGNRSTADYRFDFGEHFKDRSK